MMTMPQTATVPAGGPEAALVTQAVESFAKAGRHRLWCPPLTFFAADGSFDAATFDRHLGRLAPHVGGLLVPGSTGEGWQMTDEESLAALRLALETAPRHDLAVLIGLMRHGRGTLDRFAESASRLAADVAGIADTARAFAALGVLGFTLAPPVTPGGLGDAELTAEFAPVLERGLPVVLYQLPQVTNSTLSAGLVASLAERYPNLVAIKDSSGADALAKDGAPERLALLRGAEGDYAAWSRERGTRYRGFLLSTANVFPAELHALIEALEAGREEEADDLSGRLDRAVGETFALVGALPFGNAFTNANKALLAARLGGSEAVARLHGGRALPVRIIDEAAAILRRHGFGPL